MHPAATDSADTETMRWLFSQDLDPVFWRAARLGVESVWYAHVPFAHWIVTVTRPRLLVELGTHNGVSYSAFCEAVVNGKLETRCFAVDTWKGDDYSGFYREEIYLDFSRFHDQRYGAFSKLLRCRFDEALSSFADSSIDILHLDGLHTYDAARHDFKSWQQKLSESAAVLFHGTNLRERDFAVRRFWGELRARFPSFEFLHGEGLGVLAVGHSTPRAVRELCMLRDPAAIQAVRERFSLLGERWSLPAQQELKHQAELAETQSRIESLKEELTSGEARIASLENELTRLAHCEKQLRARAAHRAEQARAEAAIAVAKTVATGPTTDLPSLTTGTRLLYISGEPDTPGNLYRVVRYVEAANAAGWQASWIRLDQVTQHSDEIARADILIIWRAPWGKPVEDVVRTARRAGTKIVFDIDDLLVDPDLVRVEVIDGIRTNGTSELQWRESCARFHSTMLAADYCTAPTEELAASMRRFSVPTMTLPNGFDRTSYQVSRCSVRRRRQEKPDEMVRIGYAAGTRTHQRDFSVAAEAIARVLRERPSCRLVLFRLQIGPAATLPTIEIEKFPSFRGIEDQIEWRTIVPLPQLPEEMARFDINIAPLEIGNMFCQAKSELKFFEAALLDVPTIASPTGPYERAISNGVTGFLADSYEEWYTSLLRLVDEPALRNRIARAANRDALWRYGPLRRADKMFSALPQLLGDSRAAAHGYAFELFRRQAGESPPISIPEADIKFESDQLDDAALTIILSLDNNTPYPEEALESTRKQTLPRFDLVVVHASQTETSIFRVVDWVRRYADRFNRAVVLQPKANVGKGAARNVGIDASDTLWTLCLDADKRLLPRCATACLAAIRDTGAAFACPRVRKFGASSDRSANHPYDPAQFASGNDVNFTAIIAKEAWAAVGGYTESPSEGDYSFCRRLVEYGLWGCTVGDKPLAELGTNRPSSHKP
jgi:glycosyltransferase involved in cell wall biosynthesis